MRASVARCSDGEEAMKRRPISLAEFTGERESPWLFSLGIIAAIALIGTVGLVVGGLAAGVGLVP